MDKHDSCTTTDSTQQTNEKLDFVLHSAMNKVTCLFTKNGHIQNFLRSISQVPCSLLQIPQSTSMATSSFTTTLPGAAEVTNGRIIDPLPFVSGRWASMFLAYTKKATEPRYGRGWSLAFKLLQLTVVNSSSTEGRWIRCKFFFIRLYISSPLE